MNSVITWINSWTNDGTFSILIFIPLALILLFVTLKLVYHSEVIIHKTRFGGAFIGGTLIAATTSIPELIADVGQSNVGNPGSGSASDIGSNAFSMLLIAISSIILFRTTFMKRFDWYTSLTMILSSLGAITMGILMLVNKDIVIGYKGTFAIGLIPLLFFAFYLITLVIQYKWGTHDEVLISRHKKTDSAKKSIALFVVYSLLIIGISLPVSWTASSMIKGVGFDEDKIGGILLAIATSLPEIFAFFLLLRRKQPIAGVAILIGSHFFNMGITFFGDMAYTDNASFNTKTVGQNWVIAIITGIGMALLAFQVFMAKKGIKSMVFNLVIPSLAAIGFVVGWTLEFMNIIN